MIMAIYQLIGSIAMVLVLVFNLDFGTLTPVAFLYLAPMIGLCVVSLLAGISYFTKNERRFLLLSKINFWAQTVQLSIAGFGFAYYYGPYVYFGIGGRGFKAGFELLTAYFNFSIGSTDGFYLIVNAVPIFFLQALKWIGRKPVPAELEHAFEEEAPQNL